MIKKNEEQIDSGGIMLKHVFLVPFRSVNSGWSLLSDNMTEDMVDEFVKEKKEDFENDLKFFLMSKLGYVGKDENGKWTKEWVRIFCKCVNDKDIGNAIDSNGFKYCLHCGCDIK